jgi:hypothetical protein
MMRTLCMEGAPSRARIVQPTSGPATKTGPTRGTVNRADGDTRLQSPSRYSPAALHPVRSAPSGASAAACGTRSWPTIDRARMSKPAVASARTPRSTSVGVR